MDADHVQKLVAVRSLMKQQSVECLLVTQTHHFAWLTGGRSFVPMNTENGVSHLFIDQDVSTIVTTSIEEPRMRNEECTGFEVVGADWRELPASMDRNVQALAKGRTVEKDTGRLGGLLEDLQVQLSDTDLEAYRALGKDCGYAISEVATRKLRVGMSEYAAAGEIAQALMRRGIDPVVVLVAFDDRISQHRHPLPSMTQKLEKTALLVLCGRRRGLIASVSRMVSFDAVSDELRAKHDACMQVHAEVILGTTSGRTGAELYGVLEKAYAVRGFDKEITLHHQGGLTGYKSRYWKAQPGLQKPVVAGCCFAWNPSITGTKSEDTHYLPRDGGAPENLTASPGWPTVEVTVADGRTLSMPDILVRNAPSGDGGKGNGKGKWFFMGPGSKARKAGRGKKYDPKLRVWIGGIPEGLSVADLQAHMDAVAKTSYAEIFEGKGKGTGFVMYSTPEEVATAIATLNGSSVGGATVEVDVWTKSEKAAATETEPQN
eukprot:gnl/TRDRNA2_/TRDRNA2_39243_c0_seq1.p1 gnl/TRDRNA2_/TRDRNA2_39243_c0~~gnl/TRDRNA2_/TRDRNA2_39243_c0_seq1.p1  ORF type:complete len:489 (-),score=109.23 gnl/TRDRNA2_/TRDRNA2_39243_c0_seq1:61-1527(-)